MRNERERVAVTLDLLTEGLYPFVERELKAVYGDRWHDIARQSFRNDRSPAFADGEVIRWDAHVVLSVMWDQWNRVFRHRLGSLERSLVNELRDFRNRWAHQTAFDFDDAYRILDSAERLLTTTSAEQASAVTREKRDLLRDHFSREAKAVYRKSQVNKRKWQDFAVYAACCGSIVFVILQSFGIGAWFFALFVVFVFGFLAWQRVAAPPPVFFGPHECGTCGKIIYGDDCPYCETPPPDDTLVSIVRSPLTLRKKAVPDGERL